LYLIHSFILNYLFQVSEDEDDELDDLAGDDELSV
jgi:hypothetical protein